MFACAPIGQSTAHRRVLDLISKIAGTDVEILITGETGVGKERYARYASLALQSLQSIDVAAQPLAPHAALLVDARLALREPMRSSSVASRLTCTPSRTPLADVSTVGWRPAASRTSGLSAMMTPCHRKTARKTCIA